MRTQRRPPVTIRLIRATTTADDHLGNETESTTTQIVPNAIFEPGALNERASTDQAKVYEPAFFNVPGVHPMDSNDRVVTCGVTWYVQGGSTVWLDRTKIPVARTRAV